MFTVLKRSRALRLLLAVLFVPVVLIVQTGTAQAVTTVTDQQTVRVNLEPANVGAWTAPTTSLRDCTLSVVVEGSDARLHTGYCDSTGTPDFACEALDPACTTARLIFRGSGSGSRSVPVTLDRFEDGWFSQRVYMQSGSVDLSGFDVGEVCVELSHRALGLDRVWQGCASLSLRVEAPAVVCNKGTLLGHSVAAPEWRWLSAFNNRMVRDVMMRTANLQDGWSAYVVTRGSLVDGLSPAVSPLTGEQLGFRTAGANKSQPSWVFTVPLSVSKQQASEGPLPLAADIIGVGFYNWWDHPAGSGPAFSKFPGQAGYSAATSKMGRNAPGQCSFYFGERLFDDPANPLNEQYEPAGPLVEPSEPVEVEDVVPPEMPTTGDSLWDKLLSALSAIVSAILRVVSAIGSLLGKLGSLLSSLFVPTGLPFADFVDSMSDEYEASALGEWSAAVSAPFSGGSGARAGVPGAAGVSEGTGATLTGGAAADGGPGSWGGCMGPGLDVAAIIPDGMGSKFDTLHPFAACEGLSAEMAGWSRLIGGVLIAVFGGFKMLGMIQYSVIGWRNIQILNSYSWDERF